MNVCDSVIYLYDTGIYASLALKERRWPESAINDTSKREIIMLIVMCQHMNIDQPPRYLFGRAQ